MNCAFRCNYFLHFCFSHSNSTFKTMEAVHNIMRVVQVSAGAFFFCKYLKKFFTIKKYESRGNMVCFFPPEQIEVCCKSRAAYWMMLLLWHCRERVVELEQEVRKVSEEKEVLEMRIEQRHLQVKWPGVVGMEGGWSRRYRNIGVGVSAPEMTWGSTVRIIVMTTV